MVGHRVREQLAWRSLVRSLVLEEVGSEAAERNAHARSLGWGDFWELCLAFEDIRPAEVDAALADPPAETRVSCGAPAEDELVAAMRRAAEKLGVALDRVAVEHGAPPRCETAGERIRVVAPPVTDARTARALAHELGHAIHAAAIGASVDAPFRCAPSPCAGEIVADWLADRVVAVDVRARWARRARVAALERERYRAGDAFDLDRAWRRFGERFGDPSGDAPPLRRLVEDPGGGPRYLVAEHAGRALAAVAPSSEAAAVLRRGAAITREQMLTALAACSRGRPPS